MPGGMSNHEITMVELFHLGTQTAPNGQRHFQSLIFA